MFNVLDIAKYVISKYWEENTQITNLKLQKILYYIQGYSFRYCNEAAFSESIHKWPYGPVVPAAYYNYNHNRSNAIGEIDTAEIQAVLKNLKRDPAIQNVINQVIQKTLGMSATSLVEHTHKEAPWLHASDSGVISNVSISLYFNSNDPLNLDESRKRK